MKAPQATTASALPLQTLALALSTLLLHLVPQHHDLLYFNRERILAGEWWRLLSGHFIHIDTAHLLWNGVALLLLGAYIERHARRLLLPVFVAGVVGVDVLLLCAVPHLANYCGLSGVLNSLLVLVLWLYWRQTRHWAVVLTGMLCLAKAVVELLLGEALFTHLPWPPVAATHLAGLAAGVLVVISSGKIAPRLGYYPECAPPVIRRICGAKL